MPPGTYTVTYELRGFNTLKREGIQVTLGFTANLNVELTLAALQETVTVTGASPLIDTSSTRVQQNFKLEQLNSLPNARDMWELLAVTPAVTMSRIDVGGNRAGTQTDYQAYGFGGQDQQVRVLVEGINTTEGTGGAGFYFDYGSFEEVFLGTTGNGAEMATPGVQSQLLGKSGGNRFQGAAYIDWYNNDLQGSNISDEQLAEGIREGSNEMQNYYDFNLNVGGFIARDRLWWYASYRDQENQVAVPYFRFDSTFDTRLWNLSGKGTYLINQNHKLIGYYQWGQKTQPNRVWSTSVQLLHRGLDSPAGLGQLGLQGRVERDAQQQLLCRSPLRRIRVLLPAHRLQQRPVAPRYGHTSRGRRGPALAAGPAAQTADWRGHLLRGQLRWRLAQHQVRRRVQQGNPMERVRADPCRQPRTPVQQRRVVPRRHRLPDRLEHRRLAVGP